MSRPEDFSVTHEPDHVAGSVVWLSGLAGVVFILASMYVAHASTDAFGRGAPQHTHAPPAASPELGVVEDTLVEDTRRGLDLRDAQRRSLEEWGWVDRPRGIARIPIDRAMSLVAVDGGP